LERKDLLGRVVLSAAGRDKDRYFIIVDIVDDNYVLVADGRLRPESKPKKKS
jgi:LSU ribosomal protein L14E